MVVVMSAMATEGGSEDMPVPSCARALEVHYGADGMFHDRNTGQPQQPPLAAEHRTAAAAPPTGCHDELDR